jgi:endonuclease I
MRNITFLFILIASLTQAQVSLSSAQLDFGDVTTTGDKEMAVDISNTTSVDLTIADVIIFDDDFSYTIANSTIESGTSEKIRVTFKPLHNLAYNTELIFVLTDGSEHRIDLVGNGRYEGTYYSSTFNKSYQDLKDALKTKLASGYTNLGYTVCRDKMYGDIDNVGGKVTCVYTGRQATFNTRSGANSNSFNCEHTWPQSKFNQNEPERADIHHLFPTDVNSNSRRGSYAFGVVGSASWSEGGSKQGGSLFEPRDEQKGATARAMIYFAIRYQDYENFIDGQESLLKQWHSTYAPSAFEIQRNEKIFGYQKNRNPFVDHPEFLERINKIGSTDTKPTIKEAQASQNAITYNTVSPLVQKDIYIVNTGNVDWTGVSTATTADGKLKVVSTSSAAAAGEAIKITVTFDALADGTYTDNLSLDIQSQAGKTISIPVTFTMGKVGVRDVKTNRLKTYYNQNVQTITVHNCPANVKSVEVWNASGELVLLNSSFTDIPFSGHSQGVYFVVIKSEEEVFTSKFLVY